MESTLKNIKDYAKLCGVSTQAINYRIREGLLEVVEIEMLGTKLTAIDTKRFPPVILRSKNGK